MKYCEYCGEANEKDLAFCKKCGANLNYKAVEDHSSISETKSKEKVKKKVKKVKKTKKVRDKKSRRRQDKNQEVVRKMSFFQKCMMLFLILLVLVLIGIIGGFIYYTYDGIPTEVPNVVGMTYEEAYDALKASKLEVTKVNQITENTDEVGIVLSQNPKAGKKTVQHKRVKLMVGTEENQYVVPNFIGKSIRETIAVLNEAGIQYEIIAYGSHYTSGMNDGIVESQSVKAGKKMRKNETITLTISEVEESPAPTLEPLPTETPTPIEQSE